MIEPRACSVLKLVCITLVLLVTSGCTVVRVVDAAASTAVGAGKVAAKGVTAAAGALITDNEDDNRKK